MTCYYCKKPLSKNDYHTKAIGGQEICKECADGQRQGQYLSDLSVHVSFPKTIAAA